MSQVHSPEVVSKIFEAINSRLHAARFITLNNNKVMDCLADLEKIYQAQNNDSNGERSDEEMAQSLYSVRQMLIEKYSLA